MKKKLLITFLIVFSIQLQVNAQFRQLRLANEELVKENFDKKKAFEKIEKYEKEYGIIEANTCVKFLIIFKRLTVRTPIF
jgi:hypothetical protein